MSIVWTPYNIILKEALKIDDIAVPKQMKQTIEILQTLESKLHHKRSPTIILQGLGVSSQVPQEELQHGWQYAWQ